MSTPKAPAMAYIENFRSRNYAKAAAAQTPSGKRRRPQSQSLKPKFPETKMGTKSNEKVLKVVPKPNRVRDEKPKFAKALYVSGLHPDTTTDQLADYIVSYTPVTDATKFKVHKMVKKGVDVSTLKFVSFKVEMNDDDLDILDNADLSDEGVRVREFTQAPKTVLGDFLNFPNLNGTAAPSAATETNSTVTGEAMQT